MRICPKCKTQVKEEAKFCPDCGALLPEETEYKKVYEERRCPNCGEPLKEDYKFCNKCGYNLSSSKSLQKIRIEEKEEYIEKPKPEEIKIPKEIPITSHRFPRFIIYIIILLIIGILSIGAWAYFQGYIFDNEAPKVFIVSPPISKEVYLDPSTKLFEEIIEVKANDNKFVNKVELLINNSLVKTFTGKDNLLYKWQTNSKGEYIFQALAYDRSGNKSKSDVIKIKINKIEVVGLDTFKNYIHFYKPVRAVIKGYDVLIREKPTINSKILGKLDKYQEVIVYGKWISRASNEAITTVKVNLITEKGVVPLDRGKAVWIIREDEPYCEVSTEIKEGKITGIIPMDCIKRIFGETWYYVQNSYGKLGWVFGEFLEEISE